MGGEELDDVAGAGAADSRNSARVPGHLAGIRTLGRLAIKQERWADVRAMYELEAAATDDPKELVSILHRAGVITEEKLGDVAGAMHLSHEHTVADAARGMMNTEMNATKSLVQVFLTAHE